MALSLLTSAQAATLKTYLLAQTDPVLVTAIETNDDIGVANWLNTVASPAYVVWRSYTAVADIVNAISWKKLTPTDAPDGTLTWECRSLACQGYQFNIQTMVGGQQELATGKSNIHQGLSDALSSVPSGTSGATVDAGWSGAGGVKQTISRNATRLEVEFASGNGTTASPSDNAFSGDPARISYGECGTVLRGA